MQYPVAIEWGNETTATGITFPDIPNAVTAGDTIEQAYAMGVEVAHIQLEALAAEGKTPPIPSKVEDLKSLPEYEGMGWGIIDIDVTPYMGKTEKVNVTLPSYAVRLIDLYVAQHNIKSRSAFLTDVALEKVGAK